MKKQTKIPTIIIALMLLCTSFAFAAGNTVTVVVTSEPTAITANQNYAISYYVNDSATLPVNVTVKFYVDGVNVQNSTYTNHSTNATGGANLFTDSFNENLYVKTDSVYANVTVKEYGNSSVTGYDATAAITVGQSTNALIQDDTLEGLGAAGTSLGDFVGNMSGGLFKFILLIGLAVAIVGLIVAVIFIVRKHVTTGHKEK